MKTQALEEMTDFMDKCFMLKKQTKPGPLRYC